MVSIGLSKFCFISIPITESDNRGSSVIENNFFVKFLCRNF